MSEAGVGVLDEGQPCEKSVSVRARPLPMSLRVGGVAAAAYPLGALPDGRAQPAARPPSLRSSRRLSPGITPWGAGGEGGVPASPCPSVSSSGAQRDQKPTGNERRNPVVDISKAPRPLPSGRFLDRTP